MREMVDLVKTVGRIAYIVLVQTLNHAQSINQIQSSDQSCYSLMSVCTF